MSDTYTLPPVHPGEVLLEEFLEPLGLTPYSLAQRIGIQRSRLERITRGEQAITADTAIRLGKAFGMTPAFWMGLQASYDLKKTEAANHNAFAAIAPVLEYA